MLTCKKCNLKAGYVGAFDEQGYFHFENVDSTDAMFIDKAFKNLFPEMITIELIDSLCPRCHPDFEAAKEKEQQLKNGQLPMKGF